MGNIVWQLQAEHRHHGFCEHMNIMRPAGVYKAAMQLT